MEWRYIVAGVNVLFFSLVLLLIGLSSKATSLMGVAASAAVLGIVLIALGFSYTEPLQELYRDYAESLSMFLSRIAEDAGLLEHSTVKACPAGQDSFLLVLASSNISCRDVLPGVLAVDDAVYLAIPVAPLAGVDRELEATGTLEAILREQLVTRYGVCRDVVVRRTGDELRVTLVGLNERVGSLLGRPLGPIEAAVLAPTVAATGRPVTLKEWRRIGYDYVLVISVGEAESGGET